MWTWRTSWWTGERHPTLSMTSESSRASIPARVPFSGVGWRNQVQRNSTTERNSDDLPTRQRWTPAQSAPLRRAVHTFIPTRHLFGCKSSKRRSDDHLSERGQSHGYQQWQQVWKFTQTRNRERDSKAKKPLELVHIDLAGPMRTPSIDGHKYTQSFTDDYSGTILVYFLRSKSDAVQATERFLADIAPYGEVKCIRSDNGTEMHVETSKHC
jgi:hypothetical protein